MGDDAYEAVALGEAGEDRSQVKLRLYSASIALYSWFDLQAMRR